MGAGTALALLALLVAAPRAGAAQATVSWEARREPSVAGYRLYVAPAGRPFGAPLDVGRATSRALTGLDAAAAYHAAVSSYDRLGQEGPRSTEVFFTPGRRISAGGGDAVAAAPAAAPAPPLFADAFATDASLGLWETFGGGEWGPGAAGWFEPAHASPMLGLAATGAVWSFAAGRFECLAAVAAPEVPSGASIVFHYLDAVHYRYLLMTTAGLTLGQVGAFDGEPGGVKARAERELPPREWHLLRLALAGDAGVTIWVDDEPEPALEFRFEAAAAGRIGLLAAGPGNRFDEVAIWADAAAH